MATQETAPAPERPVERSAPTFSDLFGTIARNVEQVIQGKPDVIELALVCLVAEGHLLIEDVPGRGQDEPGQGAGRVDRLHAGAGSSSRPTCCRPTSSASRCGTAARASSSSGPARSSPTSCSATRSTAPRRRRSRRCSRRWRSGRSPSTARPTRSRPPFMVIATQNPIEHEGTYPLPESQLDRFLLRVAVGYPDRSAELEILDTHADHSTLEELRAGRHRRGRAGAWPTRRVRPRRAEPQGLPRRPGRGEPTASRRWPWACRRAPRCSLQRASRALAAANGRNYVVPDDVKALAGPVLAHRLMLTPEAQLQGADAGRASWPTSSRASLSLRVARLEPVITPDRMGRARRRRCARGVRPRASASSSCTSSARASRHSS